MSPTEVKSLFVRKPVSPGAKINSAFTRTLLYLHQEYSSRAEFPQTDRPDAGEWLHYGLPIWDDVGVSVLVTTSGESAEPVELCKKDPAKPLVLICNNEQSTCWRLSNLRLPTLAGPEYGNATKTYTNATAACIVFASALLERPWQADANGAFRGSGQAFSIAHIEAMRSASPALQPMLILP